MAPVEVRNNPCTLKGRRMQATAACVFLVKADMVLAIWLCGLGVA